jgi:hypothetical protein
VRQKKSAPGNPRRARRVSAGYAERGGHEPADATGVSAAKSEPWAPACQCATPLVDLDVHPRAATQIVMLSEALSRPNLRRKLTVVVAPQLLRSRSIGLLEVTLVHVLLSAEWQRGHQALRLIKMYCGYK